MVVDLNCGNDFGMDIMSTFCYYCCRYVAMMLMGNVMDIDDGYVIEYLIRNMCWIQCVDYVYV